jgi:hypothetical protein
MTQQLLPCSNNPNAVAFDFTAYFAWDECPGWWKNFVTYVQNQDIENFERRVDSMLNANIALFDGEIVYGGNSYDITSLVFKDQESYDIFKMHWTLYGE